jgi:hypothetical protein
MEKIHSYKSCTTCNVSSNCFAFISIKNTLNQCIFINDENDVKDCPEETTCSTNEIFMSIANACCNFEHEEDDEPEIQIP